MEKKILIAVDSTVYTVNALKYASMMAEKIKDISFSLIHIQPTISDFLQEESKKSASALAMLQKQKDKHQEEAVTVFEYCLDRFSRFGVPREKVECFSPKKAQSVALDIVNHATEKLYDAILVGRRGLTKIQEALMGSITAALIDKSAFIPVWIVDGEIKSDRILLAVDGSTNSFRAVDHLCFMLEGQQNTKITMLHVIPSFGKVAGINFSEDECDSCQVCTAENKQLEHFYGLARHRFSESGINHKQIEIKTLKCTSNIGKVIVCEAEKGHYGTIVVGRRKGSPSFFSTSVSRSALENISNMAVWVVI